MENFKTVQGHVHRDGFDLGYRIEGAGTPLLVIGSRRFYPRVFSAGLRRCGGTCRSTCLFSTACGRSV